MNYKNTVQGIFIDRPNRFIAHVEIGGRTETVHVKNTGRCRELLIPGAEVYLTEPGTPGRKTKYDLIAVRKENGILFNIDSQAPNHAVRDWLQNQGFDTILPEYTYGSSRIDFYMERGNRKYLMEVKGCTLEADGIGYFPDAPTLRGVKHLEELTHAVQEGYHAAAAFVIQMDGVTEVRPNIGTHPEFAKAWAAAEKAGVRILMLPCHVEPDSLEIAGSPGFVGWQEERNYVYLLRCADGTLYCGWTTDLKACVEAHNSGHGAKYTRSRRPVELVYYETFEDRHEALSREWHLKRMSREEKLELIRRQQAE